MPQESSLRIAHSDYAMELELITKDGTVAIDQAIIEHYEL